MQNPKIEHRPWGHFKQYTHNETTTVKLIHVRKGHRLSYQYHTKRSEFWVVVKGRIRVVLNGRSRVLSEGKTITVPLGALHRIEGVVDSVVLEISSGKFDERDIVRVQDDYKRALPSN